MRMVTNVGDVPAIKGVWLRLLTCDKLCDPRGSSHASPEIKLGPIKRNVLQLD